MHYDSKNGIRESKPHGHVELDVKRKKRTALYKMLLKKAGLGDVLKMTSIKEG